MRYAIIDIGSNTIRMVICEVNGKKAEISGNERASSILLECIKNGRLSLEGINFLIDTIDVMKERCDKVDKIFAFATASLRKIDNAADVCRFVKESTGVDVRLISGDEEAEYDFYSLRYINKTSSRGVGLDLGGGSCQMFSFDNDVLNYKMSLLIGSRRMYEKFVSGVIPTRDEADAIFDHVYDQIKTHPQLAGYENIYAIGGSARCAVMLYNEVFRQNLYSEITVEHLELLYNGMVDNPETAELILKKSFPDRLYSLVPGIITLCAICRCVGAEKLMIAVCGVREGFIYKEILLPRNNISDGAQ